MSHQFRILVVEDNPIARKAVLAALRTAGYTTLEAPDGRSAIEAVLHDAPDLVLQDLVLPDIDGFDLYEQLRTASARRRIPIIALTGVMSRMEEARALSIGFDAFLVKPVEPSRLVHILESHLLCHTAPDERARGKRILLVDDNTIQLKLTQARLSFVGFDVTTVLSAIGALERVRADPPDAVASDVLMPQMDGFQLCMQMKADPSLSRIPVVLVTSHYIGDEDRKLARSMGAAAYIVRTPDLKELANVLLDPPLPEAIEGEANLQEGIYVRRVLHQLDLQLAANANLVAQNETQASTLSVLSGIAEALASNPSGSAFRESFTQFLNAAGISKGALYLADPDGRLLLCSEVGLGSTAAEDLADLLGSRELFDAAVGSFDPIVLPDPALASARDLLNRMRGGSAILIPIRNCGRLLGLLLLADRARDLTASEWIPFSRTFAVQIGQAISLEPLTRSLAQLDATLRDRESSLKETHRALSAANRDLEHFAHIASHHLREPSRRVAGMSDLLLFEEHDRVSLPSQELLEAIKNESQRMLEMITDFRDLANIGRGNLSRSANRVADLVDATLEEYGDEIERRGVSIEIEDGTEFSAYPNLMHLLYRNLVSNALAHSHGPIELRFTAERSESQVVRGVRNTGSHVTAENLERIFHPFVRVGDSAAGTGVGLSVCRRIVERHKGNIWVESGDDYVHVKFTLGSDADSGNDLR